MGVGSYCGLVDSDYSRLSGMRTLLRTLQTSMHKYEPFFNQEKTQTPIYTYYPQKETDICSSILNIELYLSINLS